jgi:hypothetical protein
MSSSASLSSSPSGSSCSSASGSSPLRTTSKSNFAVKRKRVRFAKKAPAVQCLPPRHEEDKGDLWWSADELAKMSVSEVMRCLCVSGDASIGRYLVGSDRFHQHVSDNLLPVSSYLDPDPILAGLNLGYRGIEKWTDTGRFRRIESREFVKKLVYEQKSMTPEQIKDLCVAHSFEFVEYANATAYLDSLVVEQ